MAKLTEKSIPLPGAPVARRLILSSLTGNRLKNEAGEAPVLSCVQGLSDLWRINPSIFLMTAISIFAFLVSIVGFGFDHRFIAAELAWMKLLKFSISIALYGASLLLVSRYLDAGAVLKRASALACCGAAVELLALFLQVARGVQSKPSLNDPLGAAIFSLIKIAIMPVASASIVMLVLLMRKKDIDPVLLASMRWGLVLAIAGFIPGLIMLMPDSLQHLVSAAVGGHGYGFTYSHAPGTDAPNHAVQFPGWNTSTGDLRVAHFAGLHALQIMPLLAMLINQFICLSRARRQLLVTIFGSSYFSILSLLTWEALRGESVFSPALSTQQLFTLAYLLSALAAFLVALPIKYSHSGRTHVSA